MGYDRGDSIPFDFEPNGIQFGSKSNGKLSLRSYPLQIEGKWKHSFLSFFFFLSVSRPSGEHTLRTIQQHRRHVEASHWAPSELTHFNGYFDENS